MIQVRAVGWFEEKVLGGVRGEKKKIKPPKICYAVWINVSFRTCYFGGIWLVLIQDMPFAVSYLHVNNMNI